MGKAFRLGPDCPVCQTNEHTELEYNTVYRCNGCGNWYGREKGEIKLYEHPGLHVLPKRDGTPRPGPIILEERGFHAPAK